jgi:hypothetical protein
VDEGEEALSGGEAGERVPGVRFVTDPARGRDGLVAKVRRNEERGQTSEESRAC